MNDYSGEDGIVRAIRDTHRLAEEVMNATGCAVSLLKLKSRTVDLGENLCKFTELR